MTKKIAICQSNYIPWKGYFDMINMVDEFIIYDTEQYTRRDWRNRNKIKTASGPIWLSIPIQEKGNYFQSIQETKTCNIKWKKKHWHSILNSYSKSKYFKDFKPTFEHLYLNTQEIYLSKINYSFIYEINKILGIDTNIAWSLEFTFNGGKTEKLISICKQANATEYVSGPAAKNYIDEELFINENIKITWMDYSGYPHYNQLYGTFDHNISILDLIFNEGNNASKYMKSF